MSRAFPMIGLYAPDELPTIYPAGQAALPANAPPGAVGTDGYGQCVDAAGNALDASGQSLGPASALPGGAVVCNAAAYTAATGAPAPVVAPAPPSGSAPDPSLLAAVSIPLDKTAQELTAIVTGGNAAQIANLQSQAALEATILQNQGAAAQAQGLTALALQRQQQATQMRAFNQYLGMQQAPATNAVWVAAAVAALGIVAYVVYASTRDGTRARANPAPARASRSTHRSHRAARAASHPR